MFGGNAMRDPRKLCHENGIYEKKAIYAAELIALTIAEDLQAMLLHDSIRPLHERITDYINIKQQ